MILFPTTLFAGVTAPVLPATNQAHRYDLQAANVTKDGSNFISQVNDLVGTDHLTNASGTPLWVDAFVNGRPIAYHDGVNDILRDNGLAASLDNYTIGMVGQFVPVTPAGAADYLADFNAGDIYIRTATGPNAIALRACSGGPYTRSYDNNWHHYVIVCNEAGSAQDFRVDGSSIATETDSTCPAVSKVAIGGNAALTGECEVRWAFLVIYSAALTGTALTDLEAYLAWFRGA